MPLDTLNHDVYVNGSLSCKSFTPPAACIPDAAIPANAGIAASKLQQQPEKSYVGGSSTTVPAADQKVIHTGYGAVGLVAKFSAGVISALSGNATISVDLWKNGVSILTAPIALAAASGGRALVDAVISTASYVAGDIFEVKVTVNAGSGALGQGLFARLIFNESPQ